ncbi:hypothetical protein MXD61_11365 [Frankia sp. AgPm24]|uniref:hypothetical protein n=1 Tax=Frankia sp. AgPm24 TaxID=631128 RepID=UPI00200CA453|nr:hypothetical protein [Frankia sp. AgPm24]MCK9922471.1 hypothetical protein [Frankia sp. AgPm24]
MASITHDRRAAEVARQTDRALRAVRTTLNALETRLGLWRGRGESAWSEVRRRAALDALEGLAATVTAAQAAHDALAAELVAAGVLPESVTPSAAYPDETWAVLEAEGHWSTSPQALARLVASDAAADLSGQARAAVPVDVDAPAGVLVERAARAVGLADELLTAAVIAEREAGMPWGRLDEVLSESLGGWDGSGRLAEGRWGPALASWHRGLAEPIHFEARPGALGSHALPDAAIRPRSVARWLDTWVTKHQQPGDYPAQGAAAVSGGTVDAPSDPLRASRWFIGLLSMSPLKAGLGSEVADRVFWERKCRATGAIAAAAPDDQGAAEILAQAQDRLAQLRDGVSAGVQR